MQKLYTALILGLFIGFILWSNNPIDDTMNFVVGGTIPGTKSSLGFWPMIGIITGLLWLLMRFTRHLKLQMLEHTAKQITAEKARDEFAENYGTKDPALQKAILGQSELKAESN